MKGKKRARLDEAVRILEQDGNTVELFATPGPNLAGELAGRAVEAGCDLILAAGGDGTINEAVNGIAGSHVLFGALPAGTANVLAAEIGLANRPDRAAKQLLEAVPARIPVGCLERPGHRLRYFLLMAGIGLDARIVYELDLNLKRKLGKLAYWHGGFRQFGRSFPRFVARANGDNYSAGFALVTRVRNYGGDFEIARRVKLTDNDFEVVVFQKNQWHDYLRFVAAVMMNRLGTTEGVSVIRAREIEIMASDDFAGSASEGDPIHIQADGEAIGTLPATIRIVPDALTLLIPAGYLKKP